MWLWSMYWGAKVVCILISTQQGPPGKDGLPGHPGQRGETVSPENAMRCLSCRSTVWFWLAPASNFTPLDLNNESGAEWNFIVSHLDRSYFHRVCKCRAVTPPLSIIVTTEMCWIPSNLKGLCKTWTLTWIARTVWKTSLKLSSV